MSTLIVSANQLCVALEATLTEHLPATMTALGFTTGYDPIRDWQQVPTISALSSATLPAGAITSPGLVDQPQRIGSKRALRAKWRVVAGAYVRGRDHAETAGRVRDYLSAIRLTVLNHASLGGLSEATTWVGEDFAELPDRGSARTIAGGAVAFDVTALMALDLPADLPLVTTTPTTLSVR